MSDCWIGIGANLGDARAAFDAVLDVLRQETSIQLQNRSGLYRTSPVGLHAGGTFSNAAFSLSTSLTPLELLNLLQQIETNLGRTREVRWGPRPIDLDLLFIDQLVLNEPRLIVPHPGAWYRRFVLDPLFELSPSLRHPLVNETVAQLHQRITRRPFVVGFHDQTLPIFLQALQKRFRDVEFVSAGLNPEMESACVRVGINDPAGGTWNGTPVADLTQSPGDLPQRVTDFLTAVLDQPVRVGDW
jgi:2-amino-4-hydroxy-6-hydroxymethyldihydropteridine diphosphokinase